MNRTVNRWKHAFGNALVSGTVASITSTVALSMLGKAELDKSAAPNKRPEPMAMGAARPVSEPVQPSLHSRRLFDTPCRLCLLGNWYEKLRQRLPPADNAVAVRGARHRGRNRCVRRRLSPHPTATDARIRAPPLESIAAYCLWSVRSRLSGNDVTRPLLKIPQTCLV